MEGAEAEEEDVAVTQPLEAGTEQNDLTEEMQQPEAGHLADPSATPSTASTTVRAVAAAIVTLTATPRATDTSAIGLASPPSTGDSITSGAGDGQAAASSSPKPATQSADPPARVSEMLLYYRELSDHVVREGSAGFTHGFGGVLVTEWQPESRRFYRPFSLLWLYDPRCAALRNDNQELASHLKALPLLPHWTVGVDGDGDCMPRALLLGDVAGRMLKAPAYKPIWDAELALARDPLWGKVQPQDRKKEDDTLASYRQAYVSHAQHTRKLCQTGHPLIVWFCALSVFYLSLCLVSPALRRAPWHRCALR
jgi:hypothetical protein